MSNLLTTRYGRLLLLAVLVVSMTGPLPLSPGYGSFTLVSAAFADDDDDDGDDDDGGGGGRGYSGGRDDDDDRPRGAFRSPFRWFAREAPRRAPARRQVSVPDRAPNEIVAVGLDEASIAGLTQDGFVVDNRLPSSLASGELIRLTIPQGMSLDAARDAVAARAPAASVDFNHFYQPEQQASSPCAGGGCELVRDMVGWPEHVAEDTCSVPARIGLIDTAINADHDAFANSRIEVLRLGKDTDPPSGAQHGTAVAALLVGGHGSRAPGLLPASELVAVDAFQRYRKSADVANVYDLVRALDLLAAREIRIVNLSLTGPSNRLLQHAVEAAIDQGMILIAAAGNDGPKAKPVYPAAYTGVIAVTAVDRSGRPYRRAVQGEHIDIAAPGVGVWTAASISGGRQKSGTSFAAPFVTAAASMLLASKPDLTAREIEAELLRAADDMGEPGKDAVFGWGLLNARGLCGA